MQKQQVKVYRNWHYVVGGETMTIADCRKLKPVDTYLWGDVFYHLYQREDGKQFIYSEWYDCKVACEGCFVQYCCI